MLDRLIALISFAILAGFLAIIVVFVPDLDLVIVSILAVGMAGFDFYRSAFKNSEQ